MYVICCPGEKKNTLRGTGEPYISEQIAIRIPNVMFFSTVWKFFLCFLVYIRVRIRTHVYMEKVWRTRCIGGKR